MLIDDVVGDRNSNIDGLLSAPDASTGIISTTNVETFYNSHNLYATFCIMKVSSHEGVGANAA